MLRWVLPSKRLRSFYYRRRVQWIVDRSDATAVVFNTIEPVAYFRVFRSLRHPLKLGVVHNPHREGIDYEPRPANEIVLCLHDYNYRRLEAEKPVDGWLSPFFRGGGMPRGATPADTTEIAVPGCRQLQSSQLSDAGGCVSRVRQHASPTEHSVQHSGRQYDPGWSRPPGIRGSAPSRTILPIPSVALRYGVHRAATAGRLYNAAASSRRRSVLRECKGYPSVRELGCIRNTVTAAPRPRHPSGACPTIRV